MLLGSDKWTIITPILVAIIPVSASILTGLLIAPKADEAVVTIEKSIVSAYSGWQYYWFYRDTNEGLIKIQNVGGAPATNVTGYVESNLKILKVSQTSPLIITLPGFNNSVLPKNSPRAINNYSFEFRMPKLIQGEGGLAEIKLEFEKPQNNDDFNVVAIYDQGSAIAKVPPLLFFNSGVFYIILFLIGELIWFFFYSRIRHRKKFVRNLNSHFLIFSRTLSEHPESTESFKFSLKGLEDKSLLRSVDKSDNSSRYPYEWENVLTTSRKLIKNHSDFIKVLDAIYFISKREDYLSNSETNLEETRGLNFQVLSSINYALNHVEWDKYM